MYTHTSGGRSGPRARLGSCCFCVSIAVCVSFHYIYIYIYIYTYIIDSVDHRVSVTSSKRKTADTDGTANGPSYEVEARPRGAREAREAREGARGV